MKMLSLKRVSAKIALAIIACSVAIAVTIGSFNLTKSSSYLNSEVSEKLLYMAGSYADYLSSQMKEVESAADTLTAVIAATVDLAKIQKNPNYAQSYQEMMDPVVEEIAKTVEGIQGAYFIIDPPLTGGKEYGAWYIDLEGSGNFVKQELTPASEYDPNNPAMAWYYGTIKAGKGSWSNPYVNMETKEEIISYTQPVFKEDTLVGLVGIDLSFAQYRKMIDDIKIYETGYAFLLNQNYDFLVHPAYTPKDNFAAIEEGALKFITEKMAAEKQGYVEYEFKGITKILAYDTMENGLIFGVAAPKSEILERISDLRYFNLLFLAIGTLIAAIIAIILGWFIAKSIKHLMEVMERVGRGDLTMRVKVRTKGWTDETTDLAISFNAMLDGIQKLVGEAIETAQQVQEGSLKVKNASVTLSDRTQTQAASVEEVSSTMEELDASIQDVAGNINNMAANIEEVSASMNEMGLTVEEVTGNIQNISARTQEMASTLAEFDASIGNVANFTQEASQEAEETVRMAQEGKNSLGNTLEEMDKIEKVVRDLELNISSLGESADKIGNIIEVIDDIAEKTNLLALNAAIEAARAGEHGKGFAVVAGAIRDLAEKSGEATKEIAALILNIQEKVNQAVVNTKSGTQQVEDGIEAVKKTGANLEGIFVAVEKISNIVGEINKVTAQQTQGSNDIMRVMEEMNEKMQSVAAAAEEMAAGIEEVIRSVEEMSNAAQGVSASVEEQAAGVQEVTRGAEQINRMTAEVAGNSQELAVIADSLTSLAAKLHQITERFKV